MVLATEDSRKRKRVTVRLEEEDLRQLRRRWPGACKSQAVRLAIRAYLESADIAERVRTLEMISRATVTMLSDFIADGDEAMAARLRNQYSQRAIEQGRKLDARRRRTDRGGDSHTDQGASGEAQG